MREVGAVIKEYLVVRNSLNEERGKFKQFEKTAKERLDELEMQIREAADQHGVEGFKTSVGTAYARIKKQYRVVDWDKLLNFVLTSGNLQMLEKRVAKYATEEVWENLLESNQTIPGIALHQELTYEVRSVQK